MRLDADHYYQAAPERLRQAWRLYHQGESYALAMYVAGVAVECMLRAYKLRKDSVIDERHNLVRLFETCGIMDSARKGRRQVEERTHRLRTAIRAISFSWANDYRYTSEQRMRTHLRTLNLHLRIRGDWLKPNALQLLNAADTIVTAGTELWTLSRKK